MAGIPDTVHGRPLEEGAPLIRVGRLSILAAKL
jgi:hypothetical protein